MVTNYKILGQGVNSLKIDAPENGSTIISELRIKNSSYPTNVDVMCSEDIDTQTVFFELPGTNDSGILESIYAMAPQPDGKIVIGGNFTTVGGVTRNYIARLNSDGTLDTSFDPSTSGTVRSIALQPDGKIIIAGDFAIVITAEDVAERTYIARLNSDGSLDTSFDPNAGGTIQSIALQPDGKIIIGGSFTSIDGTTRNRIARLNSDGSLDTIFNPDVNNSVSSIALQPDGKIIIGGYFTSIDGTTRNRIARLNSDGTLDTSFDPDASSTVYSIALQPDGKILIGGSSLFFRLNIDGTFDASFNNQISLGPSDIVYAIKLDNFGKIVFGGKINNVDRMSRLNQDGSFDTSFSNPMLSLDFGTKVRDIAILPNKRIIVGGYLTNYGGTGFANLTNANPINNILQISENYASENKDYIIKNKSLSYDEKVKISGGIALESGQSLAIETSQYNPDTVIIQAYGIEETS